MVMVFGVSNSFKRGTVKTYSRSKAYAENTYDAQRPRKRICMARSGAAVEQYVNPKPVAHPDERQSAYTSPKDDSQVSGGHSASAESRSTTSSPTELPLVFSSDLSDDECSSLSSPPSSSPEPLPEAVPSTRRPTFSLLKRKGLDKKGTMTASPLTETSVNVRKMPFKQSKNTCTQMRIDLGSNPRKTCRTCGMEYVPSLKEDVDLHRDFCGMNETGIEMGKAFFKHYGKTSATHGSDGAVQQGNIVFVDRQSSAVVKSRAKSVLSVINTELSAEDIHVSSLWETAKPLLLEKKPKTRAKGLQDQDEIKDDRFKAFLYLDGERCVGFCLAEKIKQAFPVVGSASPISDSDSLKGIADSSSISVSRSATLALIGISRIWVSKSHRCRGLASKLLGCAQDNFFYGLHIPKSLVAFSQPTESGKRLAERWFGHTSGWLVYRPEV